MARLLLFVILFVAIDSVLSTKQDTSKINNKRSIEDDSSWIGISNSPYYGKGQPWINNDNNPWKNTNKLTTLQELHTDWNYGGIIKQTQPPIVIEKHIVVEKPVKVPPVVIEKNVPVEKIIHVPVEKLIHVIKPVPYPIPIPKFIPYPVIRTVAVPIPFVVTPRGLVPITNFIRPAVNVNLADSTTVQLPSNHVVVDDTNHGSLSSSSSLVNDLQPQTFNGINNLNLHDDQKLVDNIDNSQTDLEYQQNHDHEQEYYKKKRSDNNHQEKTEIKNDKKN